MNAPDLVDDIRKTDWLMEKIRSKESYAQNLYAAMCNTRWQHRSLWPVLKEEHWTISWRGAGGIIADLLGKGDYLDWYCSGMGGLAAYDIDPEEWAASTGYVPEGTVTKEIEQDLYSINWIHSEWPEDI